MVDLPSVVSSTDLYTETGDAPGQPGAKSEHIAHMRARRKTSNALSRDAAPVECIDLLYSPHYLQSGQHLSRADS